MLKLINKKSLGFCASFTAGLMIYANDAEAAPTFSKISGNIGGAINELPGMVTGVSYLLGTVLAALGIMKIKDHVENPQQTALKDGAIRLTAGGALFALPIVTNAMQGSINAGDNNAVAIENLAGVKFEVN
jgi:zinc transporter ZupT